MSEKNSWITHELDIEISREEDGRFIADIPVLPGVACYGTTEQKAVDAVKAMALRSIADCIEHPETFAPVGNILFALRGKA